MLLSIRDRLAGGSELNWDEHTPIAGWHWNPNISTTGWEGVTVGGEPARVLELAFKGIYLVNGKRRTHRLYGTLPPELGQLSEVRGLNLAENYLSGGIPPELGALSKLRRLNLYSNFLSGPIPPELGRLTGAAGVGSREQLPDGLHPRRVVGALGQGKRA